MRAGSFSVPVPVSARLRRESEISPTDREEDVSPDERTALLSKLMGMVDRSILILKK